MHKVKIEDLDPGMVLAKKIALAGGTMLLSEGVVIKEHYIEKLKEKNIPAVFIKYEEIPEVKVPSTVSDQTKQKALSTIKNCLTSIKESDVLKNVKQIQGVAKKLVDELQQNKDALVHLDDIRAYDEYTFGHSVDVAILSIKTAIKLDCNQSELQKVAIGALLHDIGKIRIDKSILLKSGKLSDKEFEEVRKHSRDGFNILKQAEGISIISAHLAYQHHEKYNGGGYPRKLKGDEILEMAQIVTVADIFDAITTDRVYAAAISPLKAVEIIREEKERGNLNPKIVEKFLENIPIYPVGSLVRLNNGKIGIVIKVDKDNLSSPIIRLIKNEGGKKVDSFAEIDLSKRKDLEIADYIQLK